MNYNKYPFSQEQGEKIKVNSQIELHTNIKESKNDAKKKICMLEISIEEIFANDLSEIENVFRDFSLKIMYYTVCTDEFLSIEEKYYLFYYLLKDAQKMIEEYTNKDRIPPINLNKLLVSYRKNKEISEKPILSINMT
ncbi:hypothetical protein [Carnobacterium maltaromaticum]|uniref:hypothetical protein n=1 Tax=Carnobacterium maltaromaticum TaxID=2751 RepID=UPI00295E87AF|nr:hypothetical protein [Carnobacterium maltaromaticum]